MRAGLLFYFLYIKKIVGKKMRKIHFKISSKFQPVRIAS